MNDPNQLPNQPGGSFNATQGPVNAPDPSQATQYNNQTNAPRQKGTGYTNLSQIIGANQNNQLGQTIGGGIQNLASGAQTGLQQTQNQFNQQTQQAQQQTSSDSDASQRALQQIAQNYSSPSTNSSNSSNNQQQPQTDQAGQQNQQQPAVSSDAMAAFSRLGRGQYQGPMQLNVNGQLQSNLNEVQNLGQLAGSQDKSALLQRFIGGPGYTSGQQNLDALLLGQTAAPQLAQASRTGSQLGSQFTQAQQQAAVEAQQGQQQLTQAQQQALGGVQSQSGSLDQNLAQKQAAEVAQQQSLYNQMQGALSTGTLTAQTPGYAQLMQMYQQQAGAAANNPDINSSGAATSGQANRVVAPNTQFLSKQDFLSALGNMDPTAISKSAVANQQDLAQAQALQNISGALGGNYNAGLDAGGIGTAANNQFLGINLNTAALQQAQADRQSKYGAAIADPQAQLDYAQRARNFLEGTSTTKSFNDVLNGNDGADAAALAQQIMNTGQAVGEKITHQGSGSGNPFGKSSDQIDIENARDYFAQQIAQQSQNVQGIKNQFDYNALPQS